MQIILYVNNAEENRLDKTSFLVQVADLTGTLRAGSSVVNPSVLVELPSVDANELVGDDAELVLGDSEEIEILGASDAVPIFNYAFIPEFHRYYFITDSVSVKNRLYMLTMRSDPLMSFKDSILNQSAIIDRCEDETLYDLMIRDEERPLKNEKEIVFSYPTRGSAVNFDFNPENMGNFPNDKVSYVLNVIDNNWIGNEKDLPSAPSGLPKTDGTRQSCPAHSFYLACTPSEIHTLGYVVQADDTKATFIISCISFPFEITEALGANVSGGKESYSLGSTNVGMAYWYKYGNILPYLIAMDYTFPDISTFFDFGSYRLFEIYIPYYGYAEIPYQRIAGKRCLLLYTLSTSTGSGNVSLYCPMTEEVIFSAQVQVGTRISFNTTNKRENDIAETSLVLNAVIGGIAGIGGLALGTESGDVKSVTGGITGLSKLIVSTAIGFQSILPKAQTTASSPVSSAMDYQRVFFRYTMTAPLFPLAGDAGAEYKRTHGVPSLKRANLSALTGFARIGNIHLENIPAMDSEINSILSSLASGVIF